MKLIPLAALLLATAGTPLAAQTLTPAAGIPERVDEPPPPGTVLLDKAAYVEAAARIDLYEVAAAKLAIERSKDKAVAAFAERMIRDHETGSRELLALAQRDGAGAASVPTLDTFHNTRLAALRVAVDIDRAYLDKVIESGLEAARLHGGFAGAGQDPALRGFAGRVTTLVQEHLRVAEALRTTLAPPS